MTGWLSRKLEFAFFLVVFMFVVPPSVRGDTHEQCVSCHEKTTPGVVGYWKNSSHVSGNVTCLTCHGLYENNHDLPVGTRKRVEAAVCGECHAQPAQDHFKSRHGVGFRAGQACTRNEPPRPGLTSTCTTCHESDTGIPREKAACARFLTQSPEMQRQGCLACHSVETRCDTCHSAHDTRLEIARDPRICAPCHMGPDHPQYEMWKTSKHGLLYDANGRSYAPDCSGCHMPDGSHDVSIGITMGLAGQPYPETTRAVERERMVTICSKCHAAAFARRMLSDADAIQKQSKSLVDEAAEILKELDRANLILPPPEKRPEHPLSGNVLEIGPQMLYENLSAVEAEFFRMKKFYYVTAYKGVFHQNADYAHWYGNAPLKLSLSTIRSQAEFLKKLDTLEQRIENVSNMGPSAEQDRGVIDSLKDEMRRIREKFLSGEIDSAEYERRKSALLDRHGF